MIGSGRTQGAAAATAAEGWARFRGYLREATWGGHHPPRMFAARYCETAGGELHYSPAYDAFRNIMEYSHWRANGRLVRAIVDESGIDHRLAAATRRRVHRGDDQHA